MCKVNDARSRVFILFFVRTLFIFLFAPLRWTFEEFKAQEKAREGALAAAAESMEADMEQFRKQLEADREKRLAGGRNRSSSLGVKKGKVGKKKDKKKKVRRKVTLRQHSRTHIAIYLFANLP